jgi:hypothetical protein
MHLSHTISLSVIDNTDDWLLADDRISDPLEILIHEELCHDAELAGFDSVDDFLNSNPDYFLN